MIGQSHAFVRITQLIEKIARCDAPVLIEGETGTGKELVARAIHDSGARGGCPFIPVNCGAIPDTLIENELFGHERGAYTGAQSNRPGLIAHAQCGTLFLDEVDALSSKSASYPVTIFSGSAILTPGCRHGALCRCQSNCCQ